MGGIVLAGSCGWLPLRDALAANVREGCAFRRMLGRRNENKFAGK